MWIILTVKRSIVVDGLSCDQLLVSILPTILNIHSGSTFECERTSTFASFANSSKASVERSVTAFTLDVDFPEVINSSFF